MDKLSQQLESYACVEKAQQLTRFYKTGKGEYAEGDVFLGITVPELRKISKSHITLDLSELEPHIQSKFHEERLAALFILVAQYKKGSIDKRQQIFDFYCDHMVYINNWDLVDQSAHHIVGAHLDNKSREILCQWARDANLWVRRISIVATWHYIRNNEFEDTLTIAEILLKDKEDLIHKAVGWMLREVGKKNKNILEQFLEQHAHQMPRTMLRYAIEKLPETQRQMYMKQKSAVFNTC